MLKRQHQWDRWACFLLHKIYQLSVLFLSQNPVRMELYFVFIWVRAENNVSHMSLVENDNKMLVAKVCKIISISDHYGKYLWQCTYRTLHMVDSFIFCHICPNILCSRHGSPVVHASQLGNPCSRPNLKGSNSQSFDLQCYLPQLECWSTV